ncbi:MAG: MerR family transcriptional regulator [Frankia sp.]
MAEYRIDELARAAGTTVRNVRVYQARGLLAAPRLIGRVGWYTEAHLTRLRLIGRLLARGYTFSVMSELLTAWEAGGDLADVLGLEDALIRPWNDETPATVTLAEMRDAFGSQLTPESIDRAVSLGLIEPDGDRFRVRSPRLHAAGTELVAFGIPLTEVHDLAEALQGDLEAVAARFVDMLRDRVLPGGAVPPAERVAQVVATIDRLRPLALSAVTAIFAHAMEGQIAGALAQASARRQDHAEVGREAQSRTG